MKPAGPAELASVIDHTLLRPDASALDIRRLCAEAVEHGFWSVCVNPSRVALCASLLGGTGVKVCSVAGFPLGASAAKAVEAARAVEEGAEEIDAVMALGALRDGDMKAVVEDIRRVVEASSGALVKVIIETCLLSDPEKVGACLACRDGGAAFVKTSTGFSGGGASAADIRLIRRTIGADMRIKASGGISTAAEALEMLEAGADRIGSSRGVEIIAGIGSRAAGGVFQPPAPGSGSGCS